MVVVGPENLNSGSYPIRPIRSTLAQPIKYVHFYFLPIESPRSFRAGQSDWSCDVPSLIIVDQLELDFVTHPGGDLKRATWLWCGCGFVAVTLLLVWLWLCCCNFVAGVAVALLLWLCCFVLIWFEFVWFGFFSSCAPCFGLLLKFWLVLFCIYLVSFSFLLALITCFCFGFLLMFWLVLILFTLRLLRLDRLVQFNFFFFRFVLFFLEDLFCSACWVFIIERLIIVYLSVGLCDVIWVYGVCPVLFPSLISVLVFSLFVCVHCTVWE